MQFSDLDLSKTYSYADYLQWTFEDRLELIKGKIFKMTPAPNLNHHDILTIISGELNGFLKGKSCHVFSAPFDVLLSPKSGIIREENAHTVVRPDICVICDLSKLDKQGCIGAPDIIIEILSPGDNQKELHDKYEIYEESGVTEYWIISPQNEYFLKYTLIDGHYLPSRLMTTGDIITTNILPGFQLNLETMFASILQLEND